MYDTYDNFHDSRQETNHDIHRDSHHHWNSTPREPKYPYSDEILFNHRMPIPERDSDSDSRDSQQTERKESESSVELYQYYQEQGRYSEGCCTIV